VGLISKFLAFYRQTKNGVKYSLSKVDPGGGANLSAEHFSSAGDDSYPLENDYVLLVKIPRTGGVGAVGYIDPNNQQKSNKGEKRIYARNLSGVEVVEVWLKNDGSALISNGTGGITLLANGTINLNGATIDTTGKIVSPAAIEAATSLKVGGKEMLTHTHTQANDSGGNVEQPTSAPV